MLLVLSALALGPMAAPALAAPKAYVLNYNTDSVAVIDTATNQIVGPEIPVGSGPYNIAIAPDGKTAYELNESGESITVIDLQTGQVAGPEIELGARPYVIAISPDGKTAYLTTSSGKVLVLDTQTNQVVGSIPVEGEASSLWGVAFSPDGKTAYVANDENNTVVVIDTATRQVVGAPIPVGEDPINIAFTPDGSRAYVTNDESNDVSVIDTAARQVVATIPVGEEPWGVSITPDGKKAYVANYLSQNVSVIDTQTNRVVGSPIPVGEEPYETAITPDGKTLYVANYEKGENISVIDTQTDTVKTTIADTGGGPWQIVVAPDKSPLPSFSASQKKLGGPVAFNGLASSDPDGSVASFDWTFGDGATALNGGPTPSHEYKKAGPHTASLSVTDNEGCSVALVFTGRTAYCSGSAAASQAIKVKPNRIRFGKLTKNRKHGTAKLQVIVPTAGTLKLLGKQVRSAKGKAKKAGKVTLSIRPKAKAAKALANSRQLKVRILVKLKPTDGATASKGRALTLIRR
ncbi:MAG: beta-propeller fold lactonase family protein [Solirubrobacterales bacterium]